MNKCNALWVVILVIAAPLAASQAPGTIQGKVSEEQGNRPIPGVLVKLIDTGSSALSNEAGEYKLLQVPVGNHRISFYCPGFGTVMKTDVIVRPGRITFLDVQMREDLPSLEETVIVEDRYFQKDIETPTSSHSFSAEEIRRMPGTAGFIERAIAALPGVGFHGSDENADLLVRGGGPDENGFFIDNIEVPNINHLPRLASSGGVFTAFNPDLLRDVEFYSGAFPAAYGDRLSSVTNIAFREGNKSEIDGELDLNLFMAGMVLDGPLPGGKGSWLVAGRKSYVKLLNNLKILDIGEPLDTKDLQVKLAYDLSPRHKIIALDLLADGSYRDLYGVEVTEDNLYTQNTLGLGWKAVWNDRFFSETSLSHSFLRRTDSEAFPLNGHDYYWQIKDLAQSFHLRNSNVLFLGGRDRLEWGVQIKHERDDINFYRHEYYTSAGEFVPAYEQDYLYRTTKSAAYLSLGWSLFRRLDITAGLRADHSSAHMACHVSPRLAGSLHLSHRWSITGGFGVFYQTIPMRFMAFYPDHIALRDSKATHGVLGIEYVSGSTKMTLEAFEKRYENLLIDPDHPQALASELAIDTYYDPEFLTNAGRGFARGIELLIHKKLARRFHGLVSVTVSTSRYRDLDGTWRNSSFKFPYIVNVLAGYKPNRSWEFGLRWTVMGGRPTTPFDEDLSRLHGMLYYDLERYNEISFPTFSKLNLRGERRFYFKRSNLVFYLDIWNALDREVIYEYEWDPIAQEVAGRTHLPLMPVFGLKFEF